MEPELAKLVRAVAKLSKRLRPLARIDPRSAQGEILRAIKAVLADHPDGLSTIAVGALVERRLGRRVSYTTIKQGLASNAREGRCFERLPFELLDGVDDDRTIASDLIISWLARERCRTDLDRARPEMIWRAEP